MMRFFERVNWRVRTGIWHWRHGRIGALAVLIAAVALVYYQSIALQRESSLMVAQAQLEQLRQSDLKPKKATVPTLPDGEPQRLLDLQTLMSTTPPAAEQLRKILALAQVQQISLAQGEYLYQFNPSTSVMQLQITQPVRASYPQLRLYIESVLRTLPNASLDQVSAKRENAGQGQVDARLKWSLWFYPSPLTQVAGSNVTLRTP